MLHSTQQDSSVIYMAIIALSLMLCFGILFSLGAGLLGVFGLTVVAVVAFVVFVAMFIYEWTRP